VRDLFVLAEKNLASQAKVSRSGRKFFPPPNNIDAQKIKSVCNAQYQAAKKLLERGLV
jgi:hypothetical protein